MSRSKTTPWFPGSVKPVRKGVYQRTSRIPSANSFLVYSFWNGKFWLLNATYLANATRTSVGSAYQDLPWRGLAQEPRK